MGAVISRRLKIEPPAQLPHNCPSGIPPAAVGTAYVELPTTSQPLGGTARQLRSGYSCNGRRPLPNQPLMWNRYLTGCYGC